MINTILFQNNCYLDIYESSRVLKENLALGYSNFICGKEVFDTLKSFFSLYPESNLGPEINNLLITYAGSKYVLSEKANPNEITNFSKLTLKQIMELI